VARGFEAVDVLLDGGDEDGVGAVGVVRGDGAAGAVLIYVCIYVCIEFELTGRFE
jgi:hypothetical protein